MIKKPRTAAKTDKYFGENSLVMTLITSGSLRYSIKQKNANKTKKTAPTLDQKDIRIVYRFLPPSKAKTVMAIEPVSSNYFERVSTIFLKDAGSLTAISDSIFLLSNILRFSSWFKKRE